MQLNHTVQALIASIFTWGVTAIGAGLVFFFKKHNKNFLDAMLGLAAGVMVAASFWSLLLPSIEMSEDLGLIPWLTALIGFMFGGLLLFAGDKFFEYTERKSEKQKSSGFKRCMMLMLSMTLHNIPEGMAIGVSFGSIAYGLEGANFTNSCLLALGIGIQNFPEGTAVSLPLLREGCSRKKAFFMGQISAVVEPVSAVIGALLAARIRYLLPFMLAFAAGAMIYVVVEELIPESQSNNKKDVMALFTLIGFSIMMVLDTLF